MRNTGVFLTPEELAESQRLAEEARKTPVIVFESGGRDLSSIAWERASQAIHRYALGHGLPEIRGYYGLLATGELVET